MPTEVLVVLLLILMNGFFALSEMAVMTSRKSKLRQLAAESKRAQVALDLSEKPERFLSAVQVYITLIGILTGYFGGEAIAAQLQHQIALVDVLAPYAHGISVAISVGLILFASVVLGELVPKRLAIVRPEAIASYVGAPMGVLSTIAHPLVVVLSASTNGLLRLFRVRHSSAEAVSEEEIKMLVAESAEQGVIDEAERTMVNRALTLGDRPVDSLMTPRTRIAWLDLEAPLEENLQVMRDTPYSRYPVKRRTEADVVGIVQTKILLDAIGGKALDLFRDMAPPLFVPDTARPAHLLEKFRDAETPLALVVDEYGEILGLVTLNDVALAVLGRHAQPHGDDGEAAIVQRADGSWLVDGAVAIEDLRELLGAGALPQESEQEYRTAAGMIIAHFGRIPQVGEYFSWRGFRFEVVDLDGARIDKLLVERTVPPEPDNM
ncbi:MAG TPA: hemolysin family protein [Xanthomonadales bacterium]|nr:hemolysin family protein [Xanthomonadales bacterium]